MHSLECIGIRRIDTAAPSFDTLLRQHEPFLLETMVAISRTLYVALEPLASRLYWPSGAPIWAGLGPTLPATRVHAGR
jgi:hypothetical protein